MRGLWLLLGWLWCIAVQAAVPVAASRAEWGAGFDQPTAVVADAAGQVYVLDGARDRVALLSAEGKILREFGADVLKLPLDLALAEEGLLVADTGHNRLALFRPDGALVKVLPLPEEPKLGAPEPVAVAVLDGIAFWSDRKTHRVCRTRLDRGETLGCFGGRGETPGQFQFPGQIAMDRDGYPHVVDIVNGRIQVFDRTGRQHAQISRFGLSPGELYRPNGLAIDRGSDTVFVSDGYFGTISVFRKGESLGPLREENGRPVILDSPTGLFFRDGNLYVAETGGSRVLRYTVEFREPGEAHPAEGPKVELSQKDCVLCHLSWATEAPPELRAKDAQGALPEASFRMCYSCHNGPVMDSRKAIHRGAQHPVVYESPAEKKRHQDAGPRKDKLPDAFPLAPGKQLFCTSCHTPHTNVDQAETLYQGHHNAWLRMPNQGGDLCERCHESKTKGARVPAKGVGSNSRSPGLSSLSPRERAAVRGDQKGFHSPEANQTDAQPVDEGKKMLVESPSPQPSPGGRGSSNPGGKRGEKGMNHPLGIHFAPPPYKDTEGYPTNAELHKGLPLRLAETGATLGHDRQLICQTCHQIHGGHDEGKLTVLDRAKGEMCAVCHPRQFSKNKDEAHGKGVHPVNIKRESDDPSVRPVLWKGKPEITEVGCETCHAVHKGNAGTALFPEGIGSGKALCRNCHERQHSDSKEEAHRKGVHPVNIKRESKDPSVKPVLWKGKPEITEVTCQTCHKVHTGSRDTPLLPQGIEKAEALCQNCHERQHAANKDEAKKKGVHPVNAKLDDPVEINGKKIEKVGCLSCHAVHKGKPNTAALVETDRHGELCSHCHKYKQTVIGTDHDLRITAKDKKNAQDQLPAESGVCGACHTLHRGKGDKPFLSAVKPVAAQPLPDADKLDETPFKRDALCLNCHQKGGLGEKKVVQHFSHPHEDLILRSDPKVLPLLGKDEKPVEFGRIACTTCHEPHIWDVDKKPAADAVTIALSTNTENLEGTNRDSFLRHKGVTKTLCVDCHGLESLLKYKFFHDPKRARGTHLEYLK